MKRLAYCAFALFASTILLSGCGKNNTVQMGDTASIDFTSKFSDGTLFESGSMSLTVGSGEFVKGVEDGMIGMKAGGSKTFTVAPDMGYGSLYDQNKLQKISQLIFDKTGIKAEK
jgi:FKBP-type peptidyl-prolyl cis-trans isomerase 2